MSFDVSGKPGEAHLIFPGLFRMVAHTQTPDDSLLVYDLRGKGLIEHARLSTAHVVEAEEELERLIREDLLTAPVEFVARFGRDAAARTGLPPFQMSLDKATMGLANLLEQSQLAWVPVDPERSGYRELHPQVGQAVMGTLAKACAEDAGLHIVGVTSPRGHDMSSELNHVLASADRGGAYKHFVRKSLNPTDESDLKSTRLLQIFVNFNCEVSKLDAAAIEKLQNERAPIRALKSAVRDLANEIPDMADPERKLEAYQDKANEIVKAWRRDRANLSTFARKVFSLDAVGSASKTVTALMPILAGTAVANVADATAGLGIGFLTHVGVTYLDQRKQGAASPWRFLTLAEGQGATFSVSTPTSTQS